MRELTAPPVGTIYKLSRTKWHKKLREDEYWIVERRTEKTAWLRRLDLDATGKPLSNAPRTDTPSSSAASSTTRACASARASIPTSTTTSTDPSRKDTMRHH